MSLFPVVGGPRVPPLPTAQGSAEGAADGGVGGAPPWVSGNASFQADLFQQQQALGRYATRADFLRAAERYLDSSSSEDDDEADEAPAADAADPTTGAAAAPAAGPAGRAAGAAGQQTPAATRARDAGPSGARRPPGSPSSSASSSGDSRDRKRRRTGSSRRRHAEDDGRKGNDRDGKKHKRHHRSSSKHKGPSLDREREKILRLERAAAAAGLAPRQAAALAAEKQLQKKGQHVVGEMYYDTRGDMDNVVYQARRGGVGDGGARGWGGRGRGPSRRVGGAGRAALRPVLQDAVDGIWGFLIQQQPFCVWGGGCGVLA